MKLPDSVFYHLLRIFAFFFAAHGRTHLSFRALGSESLSTTLKRPLTLILMLLCWAQPSLRLALVYGDTSELSIGSGLGYSAPYIEDRALSTLGLHQAHHKLNLSAQLGLSPQWGAGVLIGWGRSQQVERSLLTPSRSTCSASLSCHALSYSAGGQSVQGKLRLSYTPLDHLSPSLWWGGGGWSRWRSESFELIKGDAQQRVTRALPEAHWWGYSLELGTGIYWRFMSRWSTLIALELEYKQALNEPSSAALHNLYFGVTLWLNYHRYLRLL